MSQSAMAWALRRRGLGSSQKFVLVLLADSGNHEGQCLIGKRQLSELAALAEPELTGVLAMLEDLGLIAPWGGLDDEAVALNWARYKLIMRPHDKGARTRARASEPSGGKARR